MYLPRASRHVPRHTRHPQFLLGLSHRSARSPLVVCRPLPLFSLGSVQLPQHQEIHGERSPATLIPTDRRVGGLYMVRCGCGRAVGRSSVWVEGEWAVDAGRRVVRLVACVAGWGRAGKSYFEGKGNCSLNRM